MAETDTLSELLAGRRPVESHAGFPRFDVDVGAWTAAAELAGRGEAELVSLWGDPLRVHMALRAPGASPFVISLTVSGGGFPSVGRHHPPAIRLERAIRDLYGLVPEGALDTRPWLDHGQWERRAPLGGNEPAQLTNPVAYEFQEVHGHGLHQIPVGPVHAGIIEPGHFRFTANGETVARLEERLGYVHKGIDGLLTGADLATAARIVARVSGDSTVALSFAFARAVEAALGVPPPPRAVVLRGVMAELERIANHLGDIGAVCNDAAFALILAWCGIFREQVLGACDHAFGHRLMMDRIVPGGVATDPFPDGIAADGAHRILDALEDFASRFEDVVTHYDDTPSLQDRTSGTGVTDPDLVTRWAAGGHVGRASGRDFDARRDLVYPPYDAVAFAVPVYGTCDVDARVRVRIDEVRASMKMVRDWLRSLPDGPASVALPRAVWQREGMAITESFRGDVLVWLALDGSTVERCHVRDPSWFQWPLLEAAIKNNIVADFPLCNKSFNCSYSGHDL